MASIKYQLKLSTMSVIIILARRRNAGLNQSSGNAKANKHESASIVVDFLKYHGTGFGSSIVLPHAWHWRGVCFAQYGQSIGLS
ncbi:MAG: hypothetical protein WC695_04535 [Candidatus Omnitrophota bacterium]